MSQFPEPALEPSEPKVICYCQVCRCEIYEGEQHWEYDGNAICDDCMDPRVNKDTRRALGIVKKDGREN